MSLPVTRAELRRFSERSDARGIGRLSAHAALIGLGCYAVLHAHGAVAAALASFALGVFEVALFAPLHESTHDTPFRTRALNRLVGCIAGFVLILPARGFRAFHLEHHRHTQDPLRDPELIGAAEPSPRGYWLKLSGLPYWAAQIRGLIATAVGRAIPAWVRPVERAAVVFEARAYAAAYAAAIGVSIAMRDPRIWQLWLFPVLIAQPVLRYVLLAEHAGCPYSRDPWSNTRTTLAGVPFRLLFWNANFHVEHHVLPSVPFHGLARLHETIAPRLRCLAPDYVAAHRSIRAAFARSSPGCSIEITGRSRNRRKISR